MTELEKKNTWFILPNGLKVNMLGAFRSSDNKPIEIPETLDVASEICAEMLAEKPDYQRITELRYGK